MMLSNLLYSKKLTSFTEAMKHPFVRVYGNLVLLVDKATIHNYSLTNFKHIKQFGREGEGPSEFKLFAEPEIYPGKLVVNTAGKVVFFAHDGTFIEEFKINIPIRDIYPVGENFVAANPGKTSKSIAIYDKKFKLLKSLYEGGMGNTIYYDGSTKKQDFLVIRDCIDHRVYNDLVYIGDTSKGFFFAVYDSRGKKLYDANKKYKKLKVSTEHKELKMAKLRENRRWERYKTMFNYVFPEYLPAYSDFRVRGDKIYFITASTFKNDCIIVTDLKGETVKTCTVPYGFYDKNFAFCLNKDKLYYLVENEEEDAWELHVEDLI
jgi:hypothetical protein